MPTTAVRSRSVAKNCANPKKGITITKGINTTGSRCTRNLERNRIAATKCRRRRNEWQRNLERKKTELENSYKALRTETTDLIEEVAKLKHFVLAHASCNDANIDNWIVYQADKFVKSRTDGVFLPLAATTHKHGAETEKMNIIGTFISHCS